MTNIENLKAVGGEFEPNNENTLGYLMWYTLSEVGISHEKLEDLMINHQISDKYMPKEINARDAFRRVTNSYYELKGVMVDDQRFKNVLIRQVRQTPSEIIKTLVREIVDSNNQRLSHEEVAKIILDDTNDISLERMKTLEPEEEDMVNLIMRDFDIAKVEHNASHIRHIINRIMEEIKTISVRPSGGVFFVKYQSRETAINLQNFINGLSNYVKIPEHRTSCYKLPVVRGTEQNQMLVESLNDQLKKDSESLINKMKTTIDDIKKGTRVKPQTLADFADRIKELKIMERDYKESLEFKELEATENLKIAYMQYKEMFSVHAEKSSEEIMEGEANAV